MKIVYTALRVGDVIEFALQTLKENSPVGGAADPHPGLYRDSHMVFIEGKNVTDWSKWRPGQQINISNPVPYARIIEAGDGKLRLPLQVYEKAEPVISGRYGNSFNVRFVYMPVRFGSVQAYSTSLAGRAAGKRRGGSIKARRDWLVRQPALQITAR